MNPILFIRVDEGNLFEGDLIQFDDTFFGDFFSEPVNGSFEECKADIKAWADREGYRVEFQILCADCRAVSEASPTYVYGTWEAPFKEKCPSCKERHVPLHTLRG